MCFGRQYATDSGLCTNTDMRVGPLIALLLCIGGTPLSVLETKGQSSSDLKGNQLPRIRAVVGGSVTLGCSFNYTGDINDTRFGKFLTQNGRAIWGNSTIKCSPHVSEKAYLHCNFTSTITNIHPENEAIYHCEVYIPRSGGTIEVKGTGTAVSLYSEVSSVRIQPPPRFASGSRSALTCKASGFYPRNVSVWWFHGETPVPLGRVQNFITRAPDGTFTLLSAYSFLADARDHGVWCRCLVSQPNSTRERSANVTLDVGYSPSVVNVTAHYGLVTHGTLLLQVGSLLSFSCSADGNPKADMQWLGGSMKAQRVGGTLQLAAVQEEDEGTYWCVAKNKYGENNASITLLVPQSKLSPGIQGLAVVCALGAVVMILTFSIVCLLTKRMNRSPAQSLAESHSEGAFPRESQGASADMIYTVLNPGSKIRKQQDPMPHAVDESQVMYAEIKFPLTPRNPNMMEATESPIYSAVMFKKSLRRDQCDHDSLARPDNGRFNRDHFHKK